MDRFVEGLLLCLTVERVGDLLGPLHRADQHHRGPFAHRQPQLPLLWLVRVLLPALQELHRVVQHQVDQIVIAL